MQSCHKRLLQIQNRMNGRKADYSLSLIRAAVWVRFAFLRSSSQEWYENAGLPDLPAPFALYLIRVIQDEKHPDNHKSRGREHQGGETILKNLRKHRRSLFLWALGSWLLPFSWNLILWIMRVNRKDEKSGTCIKAVQKMIKLLGILKTIVSKWNGEAMNNRLMQGHNAHAI